MAVLKTTSPERSAGAPKLLPSKTVPSSKARIAESNSSSSCGWGYLYCIGWGRGESGGFVWQNDFGSCGGGWRSGAGRRVIGRRDGAAGLQGAETGERAFELA